MYKKQEFEIFMEELRSSYLRRRLGSLHGWSVLLRVITILYQVRPAAENDLLFFLKGLPARLDPHVTYDSRLIHEFIPDRLTSSATSDDWGHQVSRLHVRKGVYLLQPSETTVYWLLVGILRRFNRLFGFLDVKFSNVVCSEDLVLTGQLPKFTFELFELGFKDLFLSPTGEVQLGNLTHRSMQTAKYTTCSSCFRRELNYGKSSKGLIRTLDFEKYELFVYCSPGRSKIQHRCMLLQVHRILSLLNLPHRIVRLAADDVAFGSQITYDFEVYMPDGDILEISSVSNCGDFQARRGHRRIKGLHMHTLNGSCLPLGRLIHCLKMWYGEDELLTLLKVLTQRLPE